MNDINDQLFAKLKQVTMEQGLECFMVARHELSVVDLSGVNIQNNYTTIAMLYADGEWHVADPVFPELEAV